MAQEQKNEVLEKGDVFFFYRPRVEEESPDSRSDVQRLYMVLAPEKQERFRLMIIGRKQLPDPSESGRGRYWGFVDMVRKSPKSIRQELREKDYGTKTRDMRHQPAARPAGEGVYEIVVHKDHTHLVYALELPHAEGQVQEDLGIEEQASYIISVKNPEAGSSRAAGLPKDRQADYPKKLQGIFRNRKFANVDPPQFLNYEGAEFLLIAASEDIRKELGIEVDVDDESIWSSDTIKTLGIDREKRPIEPLVKGSWE